MLSAHSSYIQPRPQGPTSKAREKRPGDEVKFIYATFAVAKRKPEKNSFFSGFLFANAKVAYKTAMIFIHTTLHFAVHIDDFHTCS